jgi:hypothetical protein
MRLTAQAPAPQSFTVTQLTITILEEKDEIKREIKMLTISSLLGNCTFHVRHLLHHKDAPDSQ